VNTPLAELMSNEKVDELILPLTVGSRLSSSVKSCKILATKAQFIAVDSLVMSL
jgi:hypothetical protein